MGRPPQTAPSAAPRHQKSPVDPPSPIPRIPHLSSERSVSKNNQLLEASNRNKLIHTVVATAANVADSRVLPNCCTAERLGCGATRPIVANAR
jgi:hypothetical protein